MKIVILIAVLCGVFFPNQKIYSLNDFKWKNRLLIISGTETGKIERQWTELVKNIQSNNDRKLLVFKPKGDYLINQYDQLLNYKNDATEFSISLIGLDGSEKLKKLEFTSIEYIHQLIDSMPMRMNEIKKKKE